MLNTTCNSDAKVAYALVKQPGQWASSQNVVDNDDYQTSMLHLPHRDVALANTKMITPCQWYEYYSQRYPSIGYLEAERRKKQQEEEMKRQQLASGSDLSGSGSGSGWFRRLGFFGGENNDGENNEAIPRNEESDGIGESSFDEHLSDLGDNGYLRAGTNSMLPSGYLGNDGFLTRQ